MRVGLFIACLNDAFYPRVGVAALRLLEHFGCQVIFPPTQTCCGQPMFNNGLRGDAARLARKLLADFDGCEAIVTPSGSCAAMVRENYPALGIADTERIGRTWELIEFLVRVRRVDFAALGLRWPGRVTYHYSCHLRGLGLTDEVERVLATIDGLEYTPLAKREQCCGFGGTFATKFPEVSGTLVRDKVACIADTAADTLVCNEAGCGLNISGALHRENVPVRSVSLAEILAEALGLLPAEAPA